MAPASRRRSACCRSTLAAAGIDPKAIDIVLISHMHGDHILGLKTPDGALAFPNAEIKVPAVDWAYWMSDDNMSKAPEGFQKASFGFNRKIFSNLADKVTRYEWGKEVAPGITAVDASGHTPGHTAFVIASGSGRLFFQGDVSNVPDLFLRNPDWQVMFDSEPEQAAADAPAHLRHGGGREDPRRRLPLPVPRPRLHREGRHRLPAGAGGLEPGDVKQGIRGCTGGGRLRPIPDLLAPEDAAPGHHDDGGAGKRAFRDGPSRRNRG